MEIKTNYNDVPRMIVVHATIVFGAGYLSANLCTVLYRVIIRFAFAKAILTFTSGAGFITFIICRAR